MAGRRFAIVQEYVPAYRVPLFTQLAAAVAADGDELLVFAGDPAGALAERRDGVQSSPWLRTIRQREFRIFGRRLVLRALPRAVWSADLIVVEQARRNTDVPFLLAWPRTARKTALWGHGADVVKIPSRLERRYSRLLLRRAAWLFAYTQAGADRAVDAGINRQRTTVLWNSIDTRRLRQDLDAVGPGRAGVSPRAAFIGGLDSSKRIEDLISIGEAAHGLDPGFRLVIGGDGELRGIVEAAAERFSWIDHRGSVAGTDKAALLQESDLLLIPGRVGLAAIDSLAAGRPIVTLSTSLHGPEFEYLEPGVTCVVTDGVHDAARALVGLFHDRTALDAMQARCREASQNYSIEHTVRRFHDGLNAAIEDDHE
ncbi:glycosyltransferase involved in cell wall biosynthesis [Curtobacterium sp. PhB142]|uniref:glycosyltransferase family 4 protein n=1 Tax=unclassified Curtobacterium TaxID=257496 RepID=UPI0010532AFC|nr:MULTISPECIES: glycosyltransferase family 4 protein [unclassified Curtobacterium]TCL79573.1 glycosyltransferase involved in cell wall biosynthesis [Curtobacterium sp. PhB142]TCL99615.1 glycosyltransferase involved in cell wall biosynthesis [Curtobacterium sp. PhB134]